MEGRRRPSDGLGGPSPASAHPRHSSHDMRDSQASTATNASAASASSQAHEESIAFATADHGVVSVNLTDLSNALGVRRADVVSQRFMFQARSAPSHRVDRSLLGSAFGGGSGRGLFGLGSAGVASSDAATAATSAAVAAVETSGSPSTTAAAGSDSGGDGVLSASPPLAVRPAPYQRRHSTLRGTQIDSDPLAMPASSVQVAGLPPMPSASSFASSGLRPVPRRGTPPPPGGANALRRALAGDRAAGLTAGSVPSPLRGSGGLLSRAGGPALSSAQLGRARDTARESLEAEEGNSDSGDDDEGTALLASSHHDGLPRVLTPPPPLAQPRRQTVSPEGERAASPGRRSGLSVAASRSSGTATPTPPPAPLLTVDLRESSNAASAAGTAGPDGVAAKSPSRSVHFSENVIESVHPAPGEDEYMRLLVIYCRPWYAYVLLIVFGFLLGLSFLAVLYLERGQTDFKDRVVSVPFLLFLITGTGALGLLMHLAVAWRPDNEEERAFFESSEQRGQLPQLWSLGLFFMVGLTASLVSSHAISSTVSTIMVVALVGHLVAERVCGTDSADADGGNSGDCVTRWDVMGCVLASIGFLLVTANGAMEEIIDDGAGVQAGLFVVLVWSISVLVAGLCWTLFTRQLRDMSQRVSQHFLLSTSLAVCTVALGVSSYVADVVVSSDAAAPSAGVRTTARGAGRRWTSPFFRTDTPSATGGQLVPCASVFPDVAILVGGAVSFLLSWYAYHTVSFYVDHIAGAACMVMGAALSASPLVVLLGLHTWPASEPRLWAIMLVLAVSGMAALAVGAGLVVMASVKYRREVEIRIVIE